MNFTERLPSAIRLAFLAILVVSLNSLLCVGFSPKCRALTRHTASLGLSSGTQGSTARSASPIDNDHSAEKSSSSNGEVTREKISYRSAKSTDITDIAQLLNSVFDDEDEGDEQKGSVDVADGVVGTESENSNSGNNSFMRDCLDTTREEKQLSPEEQLECIRIARWMADGKKEGSLPHSFLVATIPSSNVVVSTSEGQEDKLIGFLEMGTVPSPFGGNVEVPYIGNVAVANEARRRKVGSTLVRLATKIASKWYTPSSKASSFPPFLFLSVERDNCDAFLFYDRLGFEELSVGKSAKLRANERVYLAREID